MASTSSTLLSQINEDFLTCQICMDTFKRPKVLGCQHSFCLTCLESCPTTENGSYMSCPVCRQRTLLGMKGVIGLKDNFVFSNMIEMLEAWKRSKNTCIRKSNDSLQTGGDIMCATCPATGSTMATFQCLDCPEQLCADCAAFHIRTKLTKDHEVVPLEEIECGKHEKRIRMLELSRCAEHEIEMKHFCNDCEVAVCRDCIVEDHQAHSLIVLEDAKEEQIEKIASMKSSLEYCINNMNKQLDEIDSVQSEEDEILTQAKDDINTKAEEFITAIRKRQKYLLEEVGKAHSKSSELMRGCKSGLETQRKCMENCVKLSNHLLEDGVAVEIIAMHRQIRETVEELQTKTEEVTDRNRNILESRMRTKVHLGKVEHVSDILGNIESEETVNEAIYSQVKKKSKPVEYLPKPVPRPAPRRNKPAIKKQNSVKIMRPSSPVSYETQSLARTPKASRSPHTKQRMEKAKSVTNLNLNFTLIQDISSKPISPARKAPVRPTSPLRNDAIKKGRAPAPPKKPSLPPPLPPPQNKKPLLQTSKIFPIKASRYMKFGRKGKVLTNGELSGPPKWAICSKTKKKILVLDSENRHILVFNIEGVFKKSFRLKLPDQQALVKPVAIAEESSSCLLVLYKTFITRWNWDGTMEHLWGSTDLVDANCVTIDTKGRVLVSDQEKHMIFVYNPHTRQKILAFGGFGDRDDLFKSPRYICTNEIDDIIVSDHHNHCVKVFNKDGYFVFKFGDRGLKHEHLKYPEGVTCVQLGDGSDGIMVVNEGNSKISLFTSSGKFLNHVLTQDEDKGLKNPQFVSVSHTGEELILRQSNQLQLRVYKLYEEKK